MPLLSLEQESLNATLIVGPTIFPPLTDILLRFRNHPIAVTADISKMYRAMQLAQSDCDLHRFVWRPSPDEELRDYQMKRVTFRMAASPFAATMVLQQTAADFGSNCPKAARAVSDSFYVNDCITGANSVEKAVSVHK